MQLIRQFFFLVFPSVRPEVFSSSTVCLLLVNKALQRCRPQLVRMNLIHCPDPEKKVNYKLFF